MFLLVSFALLLLCFWPLRLLRFYAGFCGLYSAWILLYAYAPCSAQLAKIPSLSERPSRWWLLVTVPLLLVTMSLLGRVITRASGFRSFEIPSISMERTIQRGDRIVADMWYYSSHSPGRPDVVIFMNRGTFFVKRVVAVGGDTIAGKDRRVFVNGQVVDEPYVQHAGSSVGDWKSAGVDFMDTFGPITVPKGKCFVMGDNRDVSLDSRSPDMGLVDGGSIAGKALYVFSSDRQGKNIQ